MSAENSLADQEHIEITAKRIQALKEEILVGRTERLVPGVHNSVTEFVLGKRATARNISEDIEDPKTGLAYNLSEYREYSKPIFTQQEHVKSWIEIRVSYLADLLGTRKTLERCTYDPFQSMGRKFVSDTGEEAPFYPSEVAEVLETIRKLTLQAGEVVDDKKV